MTKKVLLVVLLLIGICSLSYGDGINWHAVANYLYYEGGTVWLDGSSDTSIGCFAQLLWVGANGVIDSAYNTGDGHGTTDDTVVDKWIVGGGVGGADGWFDSASVLDGGNVVSDRVFFARVWSAPASDYTAGNVPTSLTNKYLNSVTWRYPKALPTGDSFEIAPSGPLQTTLTPIPEPAVMGLALVGLIGLRWAARKRS